MHGALDENGKPLVHEMNYIDNNAQLRKSKSKSSYPAVIDGVVKEGTIVTNHKLEK